MHSTVKRPRRTRTRRTARRAALNVTTPMRKSSASKMTAGQQQHWDRSMTYRTAVTHDSRWSA